MAEERGWEHASDPRAGGRAGRRGGRPPGRYLCLVYADEDALASLPPAERRALEEACVAHDEELRRAGRCLASERLAPADAATVLQVRDGRASVTDGPFAEAKEQLGGFYLIQARDLNDAIRTAARIPTARLGAIEIRPVREEER